MTIARSRVKGPKYHPKTLRGTVYTWNYLNGWGWHKNYDVFYPTSENTLMSEYTLCNDELHQGPPYKVGGPLYLIHQEIPITVIDSGTWYSYDGLQKYVGAFVSSGAVGSNLTPQMNSISDPESASSLGATAWNKFRPVKPRVQMGQFLVEIRDISSSISGAIYANLHTLKGISDAHLNLQFGWGPMIRDIKKALSGLGKLKRRIDWVRKNNNRWIHRGGTIMSSGSNVITNPGYSAIYPSLPSTFYVNNQVPSSCVLRTYASDRAWFSSMMKYFIPDLHKDLGDGLSSRIVRKLYGLELTPALAWELLPWSWLADWFGNMGDLMANASNQMYDNLVAKYAFVMRHKEIAYTTGQTAKMARGKALNLQTVSKVSCKARAGSSPFGPNVSWETMSASQLAILAAIGIQRAPSF